MADISIQIDVSKALEALGQLQGANMTRRLSAALHEAALFGERQVVGFTPVKTGALRASVKASAVGALGWKIASPLPYVVPVELGSKPHTIRPHGKFLRFPGGSGVVYARVVNHPGTRARRMFAQGADKIRAQIGAILARHLT